MKITNLLLFSYIAVMLMHPVAYAAGDAAKGKVLFGDKNFASGTKSCNDCHPNGRGLDKAADKKEFRIMGKTQKSMEDAVNACIVGGNGGKAINVKSAQMQDMVAYLKSLKTVNKPAEKSPAKKSGGY